MKKKVRSARTEWNSLPDYLCKHDLSPNWTTINRGSVPESLSIPNEEQSRLEKKYKRFRNDGMGERRTVEANVRAENFQIQESES